jgi:hypothetical protein
MLKGNGKNTVKKGEIIFNKGDELTQVGIILSGKVEVQGTNVRLVLPQGSYLALNEIGEAKYSSTYTALEDSVVYGITVEGESPIRSIIKKNADFRAIMVSSQFKMAVELYMKKTSLAERGQRICSFCQSSYEEYKNICREHNVTSMMIDELETLTPYESTVDVDEGRVAYYTEAAKIPLSANKAYFAYSEEMVNIQVAELMEFVKEMNRECEVLTEYINGLLNALCIRPNKNLYEYIFQKSREIQKNEPLPDEVMELIKSIFDEVCIQYKELKDESEGMAELNKEHLLDLMTMVTTDSEAKAPEKTQEEKEALIRQELESLKNSMAQIIRFANLPDKDAETLTENVNYLVSLPDRLSANDDVKRAKKTITPIVFKLYLDCYLKIKKEMVEPPKAVDLFLNFCMLDERLLDNEQLEMLCRIEKEENEGPCNVVTMKEWLDLIHEGEREPSKSEFDEDYTENLRNLRKQGEITEKEQKILLNDMDKRVEYEVMNMMSSNMRTVYGQPSSYMPILFKEAIYGSLDKILVTKAKINESVQKLIKLDYSVFYREVLYSNADLKIANDVVMKNVYPDIIIMPVFGSNASMWQEIGGKDKKSPGRFCFPVFTAGNLDDMMTKMFGRFHWELCRCIQGMSWNDVKVKSLTSEYMDYIQFYRKNHDLSDEAKEKIKLQLQKSRNNSREAFLIDYEGWVKNEANGSMKLNKVAREIMATYVPFNSEMRQKLNAQKPYEVAQARFIRNNQKKKQETAVKIKAVQKITSEVPQELMDTYKFYSEK